MKLKFTLAVILATIVSSAKAQNTAVSLSATNSDYISTAADVVPTSGDFTVEFWVLIPANPTGLSEFVSQGGGTGDGFYIGMLNGTNTFRAGDKWQNTNQPIVLNSWTHLALTYTAALGKAVFYINGHAKDSVTGYTISAGTSHFTIGRQFGAFGEYATATMDEIRVWSAARSAQEILQGLYGTVSASDPSLLAYYRMNETSGATVVNATGNTTFDGTWQTTPNRVYSPVQSGSNTLSLDGVNDKLVASPNTAFDVASGTVEAWVYPTDLRDGVYSTLIGNRDGGGTNYSFHLSSTAIGIWNGGTFDTVNYTLPLNTWSHLAFVSTGTQTTVYVNGTAVPGSGMHPNPIPVGFSGSTGHRLVIGIAETAGADQEPFSGNIDEVRVWNTQRTATDISTNMGQGLTGTEAGLITLYNFNQGNPNQSNAGLTTVIDYSPTGASGTLVNLALAGTSSNFSSVQAPLPVQFTYFTATAQDKTAVLQWQTAQEQNSSEFIAERSADGKTYTSIGTLPAAGNSSLARTYTFTDAAPLTGMNYYRIKERDLDGQFMYTEVRTVVFATAATQKLVWYSTGGHAVQVKLQNGSNELYTVTDMGGRNVQKGQLSSGQLDLTTLPAGLYNVKVITFNGQQLNTRIAVQ